jgi:hypothetical protein
VKEMNKGFEIDDSTIKIEPYFKKPKNAFDFTDSYTYSDFTISMMDRMPMMFLETSLITPKELLLIVIIRVRARILRNQKMELFDIVKKLGSSGLELKTSKSPMKLDTII